MLVNPFDWTEGIERYPVYSEEKSLIKSRKKVRYVKTNIPGPGCNIEDFEDQLLGCSCSSLTCDSDCSCISRYGKNYDNKCLVKSHLSVNKYVKPVFECNSRCTCRAECPNRIAQQGVTLNLQVLMTDKKGLGLRTLETISVGQFVCEYAGEILSPGEARRRSALQTEDDMNYILTVKEHHKDGVIVTHVDPALKGNIGRYINHSCTPNLLMVPVRVEHMVPRLCLFALSDIQPLQELCFDYGSNLEKINKSMESTLKPCFCDSEKCKGYLPFDETLF